MPVTHEDASERRDVAADEPPPTPSGESTGPAPDALGDGAATAAGADRSPRRPRRTTALCALAAVLGLAVLAVGGLLRHQAATDPDLATAVARDRALVAARTEIATLNTLDYRDIDGGIDDWLAASTGTLRDQLAQTSDDERALLADQAKVTSGTVVGAALTDLDADAGTATAIASVEITVRSEDGQTTLKRNRFSAQLVRTRDGWKLETLGQVAVEMS